VTLGGAVRAIRLPTTTDPAPSHLGIEHRTALDFLDQLLDVTSSPEAVAELERENQILEFERRRVLMDLRALNERYVEIVGDGTTLDCVDKEREQRNGIWLEACLHGESVVIQNWNPGQDLTSEKEFRTLVSRADRLFRAAKNFASEMAAQTIASRGRELEAAIVAYQSDSRGFESNLSAAEDAALIMKQLADRPREEPLLSLQIWSRLRRRLTAEDGATPGKPMLDEAEANAQIDRYFTLLKNANSIPQVWRGKLTEKITAINGNNGGQPIDEMSSPETALAGIRDKLDQKLPDLISQINDWQQRLAARLNAIYESSEVPVTEGDFGLDGVSANGVVAYRILRTKAFEPYVFGVSGDERSFLATVEVSRGAFAVTDTQRKRTVWQILRLTH